MAAVPDFGLSVFPWFGHRLNRSRRSFFNSTGSDELNIQMRDWRRHKIRKSGQFTVCSGSWGGFPAGRQGKEARCSQGERMVPGIVG
jgi:hypothetical protein